MWAMLGSHWTAAQLILYFFSPCVETERRDSNSLFASPNVDVCLSCQRMYPQLPPCFSGFTWRVLNVHVSPFVMSLAALPAPLLSWFRLLALVSFLLPECCPATSVLGSWCSAPVCNVAAKWSVDVNHSLSRTWPPLDNRDTPSRFTCSVFLTSLCQLDYVSVWLRLLPLPTHLPHSLSLSLRPLSFTCITPLIDQHGPVLCASLCRLLRLSTLCVCVWREGVWKGKSQRCGPSFTKYRIVCQIVWD